MLAMAACGRLQHIFEKPLPESPTFLESLSHSPWKQIKSVDSSSCREFFGEIHFKEHNHHVLESSSSSSSSTASYPTTPVSSSYSFFEDAVHPETDDDNKQSKNEKGRNLAINSFYCPNPIKKQYSRSNSFSSRNSESLSMCTEGLGFESSDDVEDFIISNETTSFDLYNKDHEEILPGFSRNVQSAENSSCTKESKKAKPNNKGVFPPPISCIGRTGKPWVSFKSFREDGRFILQEIRIPTQEFLHACREDGRLRLQFIQSDDEIIEEEGETEDEEEEQDDEVDDIQVIKEENEEDT